MVTYTGVLLGATAIPVWNENVRLLPLHFAASGIGSAAWIAAGRASAAQS